MYLENKYIKICHGQHIKINMENLKIMILELILILGY